MNKENLTFYCIYTRNHSENGQFKDIINDLKRFVYLIKIIKKEKY